jgi:hypothetical protein
VAVAHKCLGCGYKSPETFLDLGETPLANSYLTPDALKTGVEAQFRLAVCYCPKCHLVQLTDLVPPEDMFSEYLYFSSYSQSFLEHASRMADELIGQCRLGPDSSVVEIASNDGYLLKHFVARNIPSLGIEPAANIAEVATEHGIPTLCAFYNVETAERVLSEQGPADLIVGNNVMAHVPDTNGFARATQILLAPNGTAVFEMPWLGDFMEKTEFDTIYHEHVFYFSLSALCVLFDRAGLYVHDVQHQPVHGGTLRVFVCHNGAKSRQPAVQNLLDRESAAGLMDSETYRGFARKVQKIRADLRELLESLKAEGKVVGGYGAAAKGSTLLNYCGVDVNHVSFIADRSNYKQGRHMPGVHIPIVEPAEVKRRKPDYLLILAWNLKDEIMEQMGHIRQWGGRFILPVPEVKVAE